MGMPREVYNEIISQDEVGPNDSGSKAAKLRVYPVPSRFTVKGSSKERRWLCIYLAIVSDTYVYVVEDFSRLARLWFKSRSRLWLRDEVSVKGDVSYEIMFLDELFIYCITDLGHFAFSVWSRLVNVPRRCRDRVGPLAGKDDGFLYAYCGCTQS